MLVELGVHHGVSYTSFCEAVRRNKLNTRCFGIDTWQGDEHAGFYGEEVFLEFEEFHKRQYSTFSTLIRSTFDAALADFENSSIDLIHIDGRHTYEQVSHDFETWSVKLSNRAIVLFHDTQERKSGFGVWQFWDEVRTKWPSFEFKHEHGLGVLAFGSEPPKDLLWLFENSLSEEQADRIRSRFQLIGEAIYTQHRS
ncbi:class I SAM-dependent methyltransferase [Fulvimarina sp. MAC3]|uniref:class I SAM-dependent methyltransferase n=1 Tax=Fulvimarina sp. MAC3 TaxID=3148887 RepID=UPI0031FCC2D7